ncbi:MAG: hypothetical protein KH135_01460 [Firmicutes bacterium]|nr:hypothetical protein [Bacillota bacterium]
MKELLKNKFMILLLVVSVGITYVSSMEQKKMEEDSPKSQVDYITMNVK